MRGLAVLVILMFALTGLCGCTASDWISAGTWYQRHREKNSPERYWSRYASENIRHEALCGSCRGSGISYLGVRCRRCGGSGYAR